jgi:spore coat protein CotF
LKELGNGSIRRAGYIPAHFDEKIMNYMIARGFYHPHDLSQQLEVDLNVSDTALKLAQK